MVFSLSCDIEISVNFGKNMFFYDIMSHDWTAGDSWLARRDEIHARNNSM